MAKREGLKAVLFDLDGTLINLNVDWEGLRNTLQGHFMKYGFQMPGGPLLDSLREMEHAVMSCFSMSMSRKIMDKAFKIIRQYEIAGLKKATLCEGALEVLKWLKDEGIPFAIVSNNDPKCIYKAIKQFRLPQPSAIVGRDGTQGKPNPAFLERALNLLNLDAGLDIWMVGDSEIDMKAGRKLHLTTILIRRDPKRTELCEVLCMNRLSDLVTVWRFYQKP